MMMYKIDSSKIKGIMPKTLKGWGLVIVAALIIFLLAAMVLNALLKIIFVHSAYNFFSRVFASNLGFDAIAAKLCAIFLALFTVLLLPSAAAFMLFNKKRKKLLIAIAIIFVVCYIVLYFGTSEVFFDRQSGKVVKYYIKTLKGFKFSSSEDIDPQFGIKYKPITPEVQKEYYLWQKTGRMNTNQVVLGKYFDMLTGEPIAWYIERKENEVELFSLPGFDPITREPLKPMSKEMGIKINNKEIKIILSPDSTSNYLSRLSDTSWIEKSLADTDAAIVFSSPTTPIEVNKGEIKFGDPAPPNVITTFASNKPFIVWERTGNDLLPIHLPAGTTQRYYAWAGRTKVEGIEDGTKIKISHLPK